MHFVRLRRSRQSRIGYDYRSCDKAAGGFRFYGPALGCPLLREEFNESHKLGSRMLLRPTSIL